MNALPAIEEEQGLLRAACDEGLYLDWGSRLAVLLPRKRGKAKWYRASRRGTLEDVTAHFREDSIVGFVTKDNAPIFCRDIDAHGITLDHVRQVVLENKYFNLVKLHGYPSMVCRSSRHGGLHAYWWVDRRVPHGVIKARLLAMAPDEVLPTPRRGSGCGKVIKMPGARGGGYLSPLDLTELPIATGDVSAKARLILDASKHRVPIDSFLGLDAQLAKSIFRGARSPGAVKAIFRAEASFVTRYVKVIRQGATNDPFLAMVRECVSKGISEADSVRLVDSVFQRANIELKNDTQGQGLESRTKSARTSWIKKAKDAYRLVRREDYARIRRISDPTGDTLETAKVRDAICEQVMETCPAVKWGWYRKRALRDFVFQLVRSVERYQSLTDHKRWELNMIYPGSRRAALNGLVPLPVTLMRRWGHRYLFHLRALMMAKVLLPGWDTGRGKAAGYCPGGRDSTGGDKGRFSSRYAGMERGKCRFYRPNFPRFL